MSTADTAVSLWTLQCLEADFSLDTAVSIWTLQCPQSNSGYHKTLNNFFPVRDIKFPSSQLILQYYSWIFEMIFFTLAQNFAKNCGHCNIHGGHCSVHADTAVSTADTGRFLHTVTLPTDQLLDRRTTWSANNCNALGQNIGSPAWKAWDCVCVVAFSISRCIGSTLLSTLLKCAPLPQKLYRRAATSLCSHDIHRVFIPY